MPRSLSWELDTRDGLGLGWRFINSIYPKLLNSASSIIISPEDFFFLQNRNWRLIPAYPEAMVMTRDLSEGVCEGHRALAGVPGQPPQLDLSNLSANINQGLRR